MPAATSSFMKEQSTMRISSRQTLVAALTVAAFATPVVWAETTFCTKISAVPFTITASGNYCLDRNLATASDATTVITIDADHVTLDLNGFKLDGSAGAVKGIHALNRKAVVVRKPVARKAVAPKPVARKSVARKSVGPKGPSGVRSARSVVTRNAPALDRPRRTVQGTTSCRPRHPRWIWIAPPQRLAAAITRQQNGRDPVKQRIA